MNLPDEEVEAAAKAIWEARPMERDYEEGSPNYGGAKPWEGIKQYQRERCMKLARSALTAAARFVEQGAYDRGWGAGFRHHSGATKQVKAQAWEEGWAHYRMHFSPNDPEYGANPYRSGT